MSKRITWKKGMRLSTEVFTGNDRAVQNDIKQSALLASKGQIGLYTSPNPFELSVNITNNTLEIVSLSCHGITRNGMIVDIEFDSNYNNTFDTLLTIPTGDDSATYLLVVKMHEGEWREVDEHYSEEKYSFALLGEHSPIDDTTLPIGAIVNQFGWRLDENDFCPPCLFVSAHRMYMEQAKKAQMIGKGIADECLAANNCMAKVLLSEIWPAASTMSIKLDKERDLISPNELFAQIQLFINAFIIGCSLDNYINLENYDPFVNYIKRPNNIKNLYQDIEEGLNLCAEISVKMETVCNLKAEEPEIQEKPQPRQPSPSQPKPEESSKNKKRRWEGLEI